MKNRFAVLLFLIFPFILFGGEKHWNGKNMKYVKIEANGCYVIITTDKNPKPVSMKYSLPDKLIKMENKNDTIEINVGKTIISKRILLFKLRIQHPMMP
ncbi:MAG TPA: hypothetical protein ENJ25_01170, partial [Firmicutes bacterium]|nr:hypothetical protein [Bacillota bacterium]